MSERLFKRRKRDGTWSRILYGWYYELDGTRRQKSTRCTDRRAASKVVDQWERDAADPQHAATQAACVRDALALVLRRADHLASTKRRSLGTQSYYRAKCGQLARLLEPDDQPTPLRLVDASMLDRYVEVRREEEAADTTIRKELAVFSLALKLAKRAKIWSGDREAIMPELEDATYVPRTRWLPYGEAARLLGELIPDHAARVAFILATGARWSETESVTRAEIEGASIVPLHGTKTRLAERLAPIVLEEQRELVAFALTHAGGEGTLFAPWPNVRRDLAAACKRAGIERCSPNDLRRTLAHWLRQAGAPSDLVAPVLGHADTRMVQRVYGRLVGVELADALARSVGAAHVQQLPRTETHPADSPDTGACKIPGDLVPRVGIEPTTRGFSGRSQRSAKVRILWPNPKTPHHAAAPVQQPAQKKSTA